MRVVSLGYATDLAVLALEGSEICDHGDHLVVRTPGAPTYYLGNFVLIEPPTDADAARRALDRFAREFPGAQHVALGIDATDVLGAPAGWAAAGLDLETCVVLRTSQIRPPSRALRAGIVVRQLSGDEDWVQELDLRTALAVEEGQKAGVHLEFLAGRVAAARRLSESGFGARFGAFVAGRLASSLGIVASGDGLARYQTVQTDQGHRRQGMAGWLVHAAGVYGRRELGADTLVMVADPEGPAIALYRALGFADAEQQTQWCRSPDSPG